VGFREVAVLHHPEAARVVGLELEAGLERAVGRPVFAGI
jgi:hypothetical protein